MYKHNNKAVFHMRPVGNPLPKLAFKIKIVGGMEDFFQGFFLAKGTFRRIWTAAFSGFIGTIMEYLESFPF